MLLVGLGAHALRLSRLGEVSIVDQSLQKSRHGTVGKRGHPTLAFGGRAGVGSVGKGD